MKFFFILILLPITSAANPPLSFSNGLKSYQKQQYEQASVYFLKALQKSPHNSTVLYNLGLTELQRGNQGRALGYLRRAQYLDPYTSEIKKALDFINSPHNTTFTLRDIFRKIPIDVLMGLFTLGLILMISTGLNYLHKRTQQTSFPIALFTFFCCTFIFGLALGYKIKDQHTMRVTVIVPKAEAHSGPNKNQATLFEIKEGIEVLVHKKLHSWLQVTAPSGGTGWIHENTSIISWGKQL